MILSKDEKILRMQVWLEAWVKTAQSDSCTTAKTATHYADQCLVEFEQRFISKKVENKS